MLNKKAQQSLTKTGILGVTLVFYSFIIYFIGVSQAYTSGHNIAYSNANSNNVVREDYSKCNCGTQQCQDYAQRNGRDAVRKLCTEQNVDYIITEEEASAGRVFGLGAFMTGIENIPVFINVILFTPLFIILGWIIFSSLPTFNGGG